MLEEVVWSEKYRPKRISELILPEDLKATFQKFVDSGTFPNILTIGRAGVGKTSACMAMLDELGCDFIFINASMDGNIDTLRTKIQNFASTVSFSGGKKYVILDEGDRLTPATQDALKSFMETFSKNCGFLITTNHINKIIEPIRSRCTEISFKIERKDLPNLAGQFHKRCCRILEEEKILYDKAAVAEVVTKFIPDWRKILNELQRYSAETGSINSGILRKLSNASMKELVGYLKGKDYTNMRKWVSENSDSDPTLIFREIYDEASEYLTKNSIPAVVLTIGKYSYQHQFCADPEINLVCCLTELMIDGEFL